MGNRIVIIGNAGGGKSVFADQLHRATGLPLHRLDSLQWNAGWVPTPPEEFDRRHDELIRGDRWIIDGFATWQSIERRFEAADTIILVDHPLRIHYWWAIKRQFMCLFRPRPDFVVGCPMLPKTVALFRVIRDIHHNTRPRLIELVQDCEDNKWIYHIKSPGELREFVSVHCSGSGGTAAE